VPQVSSIESCKCPPNTFTCRAEIANQFLTFVPPALRRRSRIEIFLNIAVTGASMTAQPCSCRPPHLDATPNTLDSPRLSAFYCTSTSLSSLSTCSLSYTYLSPVPYSISFLSSNTSPCIASSYLLPYIFNFSSCQAFLHLPFEILSLLSPDLWY
jgi:hypothetical protein